MFLLYDSFMAIATYSFISLQVPSASKEPAETAGPSTAKKFKAEELSAFKDQKKTNDPSKIKVSYFVHCFKYSISEN